MTGEDERTNAVGLFNYADSYVVCARRLIEDPPPGLRFDAPLTFLLLHAAELYLKSFLRQNGEPLSALRALSHRHGQLVAAATARGLRISENARATLEFADASDAQSESRYIRTGFKQHIEPAAMLSVVLELRRDVKEAHGSAGVMLRATRVLP